MYESMQCILISSNVLQKFYDSCPEILEVYIPEPDFSSGLTLYDNHSWFDHWDDDEVVTNVISCEVYWKKPVLQMYLFPNIADPLDEIGPVVRKYGMKIKSLPSYRTHSFGLRFGRLCVVSDGGSYEKDNLWQFFTDSYW